MRILAVSGSLRQDSYNTRLLHVVAARTPDEVLIWDGLRDLPPYDQDLPPYDQDAENGPVPEAVARWRTAVVGADALLFATPEYNASIPGALKNAVDWASRPHGACALLGRPAAVVGASTGSFGAVWAQAELRKVLRAAGARVVDVEVAVPEAADRLPGDGLLRGRGSREALTRLLDELRAAATDRAPERRVAG